MEKCYKILHRKNRMMNSKCLRCEYWKKAVKNATKLTCYDYFNCVADCDFKNGKIPTQNRKDEYNRKKNIVKQKELSIDAIVNALVVMMGNKK